MTMKTSTETKLASIGFTGEESRKIIKKAEVRTSPKDAVVPKWVRN